MKHLKYLLVAASLLASFATYSQTFFPKVGFSFSTVSTTDVDPAIILNGYAKKRIRVGFVIGCGLNFPLSKVISLQSELLFVQKGTRTLYENEGFVSDAGWYRDEVRENVKINYLEMPVVLKYAVTSMESKTPIYLIAGPSVGVGMGGKIKHAATDEHVDYKMKTSWEDEVKFSGKPWQLSPRTLRLDRPVDVGMQIGGGILVKKKLMIELRYAHSFTSLKNSNDSYENKIQNQGVQLSVGLPITLR
jgi:hypothetical protein